MKFELGHIPSVKDGSNTIRLKQLLLVTLYDIIMFIVTLNQSTPFDP